MIFTLMNLLFSVVLSAFAPAPVEPPTTNPVVESAAYKYPPMKCPCPIGNKSW